MRRNQEERGRRSKKKEKKNKDDGAGAPRADSLQGQLGLSVSVCLCLSVSVCVCLCGGTVRIPYGKGHSLREGEDSFQGQRNLGRGGPLERHASRCPTPWPACI